MIRCALGSSGSVVAASTHHGAICAYDVQTFCPVINQPSPSGTARVRSDPRSEPASGSLKPWHQMTSPAAIGGRCWSRCASVPWRIKAGPTQLTPMYCAPRGSWCAHISSRTTVCSQTEPPPPPYSLGQARHSRPSSASSLQNDCVSARSAGSLLNAPRKPAGMCSAINARSRCRSASAASPSS